MNSLAGFSTAYHRLILLAFVFPKTSLSNMIFSVTRYTAVILMMRQVV